MYTGYFANLKEYQKHYLIPVSIALYTPDWFKGVSYTKLAPSAKLLNDFKNGKHAGDIDYYTEVFNEQLSKLNPKECLEELDLLTENKLFFYMSSILLCFEKDGFCHRHLVAKWIRKAGIYCAEFKNSKESVKVQ